MKIEVLTIGDEVLSGTIVDTNAAWLGDQLWTRGLGLHRHSTVGDDEPAIAAALVEAAGRSDVVVVTGGLGPTLDDITVAVAARTFGFPLVLDEPSLEHIREIFRRTGREMSPTNEKQAWIPAGAAILPNPDGTAPGVRLEAAGASFAFLPGVPREMKAMFERSVLPWILDRAAEPPAFAARVLRCFGLPEATVQERLLDLDTGPVDLAFRPVFPEILLKLSLRGMDGDPLQERVDGVAAEVRRRLGLHVTAEGDTTLAQVVGDLLRAHGSTLAVAEAGTGGAVADLLTDRPDSGEWFVRGEIATAGPVGADVATARAAEVRDASGATLGLAAVGVPGPDPAGDQAPGTLFIALAAPGGGTVRAHQVFRDRGRFKRLAAFVALDAVRRHLLAT